MNGARGFTLIELMVALTLFALLAGGGLAALSAGTRASAKAKRYNAMVARGQGALELIARDLRAAVQQGDSNITSLDRESGDLPSDTIDFIEAGPPRLDEGNPEYAGRCEVGYYIDNDPDTALRGLVRREDASLDDDLLEGGVLGLASLYVSALNIQFYDGLLWQSGWVDQENFPLAASIEIQVVDEGKHENPITLKTTVPIMVR